MSEVTIVETSYNQSRGLYSYNIVLKNKIIGLAQLRVKPSKSEEMPINFESHIYYEIEDENQNKGYATEALKMLIGRANKLKLSTLYITVNSENLKSIRVIEKCGGIYVVEGTTSSGKKVLKYKILTK